ncbi:hypothetical protein RDI58_013034 [Solanum bulbocastanum]
MLTSCE